MTKTNANKLTRKEAERFRNKSSSSKRLVSYLYQGKEQSKFWKLVKEAKK